MEKLHTTSKIKKALMMAGATMALGGAIALTNPVNAEASELNWNERPLTEIQMDIQEVKESESIEYQIQWGDTLGNIAKALDMDLHTLANANGIGNIDVIIAGQYLVISEDAQGKTQVEVNKESSKPVTTQQTEAKSAPVEKAKPEPKPEPVAKAPVETVSGSEAEAKAWIAQKESNDNYNAVSPSGKYIGKFQLTNTYLNGDHSPENQERVAEKYVAERYGSWVKAKEFWLQNGWY